MIMNHLRNYKTSLKCKAGLKCVRNNEYLRNQTDLGHIGKVFMDISLTPLISHSKYPCTFIVPPV